MCIVSFVSDHYNQKPILPNPAPWPQQAPVSLPWDERAVKMLEDVLARLKRLDEALGLADCEDPKKQEWLRNVKAKAKRNTKKKQVRA